MKLIMENFRKSMINEHATPDKETEELEEGVLGTIVGLGAAYYLFKKFLSGPVKLMYDEDPEFREMIDGVEEYIKNRGRSK